MRVLALSGVLVLLLAAHGAHADEQNDYSWVPTYTREVQTLVVAPGVSRSVAAGILNPSVWGTVGSSGLHLRFVDESSEGDIYELAGVVSSPSLFSSGVGVGYGYRYVDHEDMDARVTEHTMGLTVGESGALGLGASYAWNGADKDALSRHDALTYGFALRSRWGAISGFRRRDLDDERGSCSQLDVGVRPFGPRFTVFADIISRDDEPFIDGKIGYGIAVMPLAGLELAGRADGLDGDEANFGLRLSYAFGSDARADYSSRIGESGSRASWSAAFEFGPHERKLGLGRMGVGERYPEMKLKGGMTYRRRTSPGLISLVPADERRTLFGTLQTIDIWSQDPGVGGVVLDLSGFRASPAMLWEIREQLAGLRRSGKKVIVYLDRVDFWGYMLASVADQIWVDPEGGIYVSGLNTGRTYYRGALDKIGLGVEEFRLFTYKSAMEGFTRDSMSDADREQLGLLVDDWYDTCAELITEARGIERVEWDRIVDEEWSVVPERALESGLVDSIGAFQNAKDAAEHAPMRETGDNRSASLGTIAGDLTWGPYEWGKRPRIAVFYAIGPCDVEKGIEGRRLAEEVSEAGEWADAIVLRVDSPGGDGLASDLVSRELKKIAEKKPVIVSQGQVAASGGYHLSAYGDSILAAPVTLTGSIGVIGGHFWDAGMGDSLGIKYDSVKRGEHADLYGGMTIPLLGSIPDRPYTAAERAKREDNIRYWYDVFVGQVAEGRGMSVEEVDEVAQGRVWSGRRGKELGLVDETGGLWESVRLAKEAAGIGPDQMVDVVHRPQVYASLSDLLTIKLPGIGFDASEHREREDSSGGPWELDPGVSRLRALVGDNVFSVLPAPERVYLEYLLRSNGGHAMMMPPVRVMDGGSVR
ncbi:MAG: hypothetical protein GF400_08445 [Candidatus Eisenbacteria bacterium]|nr:hypothetical protein [Candidatus Eisenbacteria bacterium]